MVIIHASLIYSLFQDYRIGWEGPPVIDVNAETVNVPNTDLQLNNAQMQTLASIIDPLNECEDHGVNYYLAVSAFIIAVL